MIGDCEVTDVVSYTKRLVTLFSAQFGDMPLPAFLDLARAAGYDGVEIACGTHLDVQKALNDEDYRRDFRAMLDGRQLQLIAISNHCAGQAVLDHITPRHQAILPPHVWGDGNPAGVNARAAREMVDTALVAAKLGVGIVNGFTGSPIWREMYPFPPVTDQEISAGYDLLLERWGPILKAYEDEGIKFALEVHPTEIAFDTFSAQRTLKVLETFPAFGFNFDPSHLNYQGVDPALFLYLLGERVWHTHIKDVQWGKGDGRIGVFGGHAPFGDPSRYWDFRSPGRGMVDFEAIMVALNHIGYTGPLSVEWEDSHMDREHGAHEALDFVRALDFPPSKQAFDAAFRKASETR
ncbi:MAG: sugar phosphate isomerase/epimerase family protein [bacterium]|nr:sugar phosphate isomerase/epimerase family protein [bacterium]